MQLYIGNKNYSSWSMRPWVLMTQAGIAFEEVPLRFDAFTPGSQFKSEVERLSPAGRVPILVDDGLAVWDTLAIAEYLNEIKPEAGLLPADPVARAHCRAVCGEMHSGFANLRSALPMNLKVRHQGFKVWAGAQADIERVTAIWRECLQRYGGPYLFGKQPTMADAMYAPVCSRFATYDVKLDAASAGYRDLMLKFPAMLEWTLAAKSEPEEVEELDVEF